jgi:LysR family transcriptional regulator, low CO2-responsive transcriptional regulator
MRLNPEQLLTFAAVVRECGVGAAALRLHLTQPAVSNQLKRLQETLGEALYRRAGRGIALTGAGQRLYVEAQRLADALNAAQALADSLSSAESGLVRITASQTLGAYLLPPVVAAFREHAPGIEIELASYNSREVAAKLLDCDIALTEGPLDTNLPDDRQAEVIAHDEIVAVLRSDHPLAQRRSLPINLLATQPLIWRERGSGTRAQLEQAFREAGVQPRFGMALAGVAAVKEAVRQGLGIGFASRLALRHEGSNMISIALSPPLTRELRLIAGEHPSAAAARFLRFLRQRLDLGGDA